jgi:uncharacterized phage protein (TIGR02216 family)
VQHECFPWPRIMRLGLGELRLPPEQFWRMSLKELLAAFANDEPALNRDELTLLMQRWPDEQQD